MKAKRSHRLSGPHLKQRVLVIQEGRPAKCLAWAEGLQANGKPGGAQFNERTPCQNQVKKLRPLAVLQDQIVILKSDLRAQRGQLGDLLVPEAARDIMPPEDIE